MRAAGRAAIYRELPAARRPVGRGSGRLTRWWVMVIRECMLWPLLGATERSHRRRSRAAGAALCPEVGAAPPAFWAVVRLGQPERVLGDVVEDHLARDRRGARDARAPPQVGQAVLEREAVATVGLDCPVDAVDRRLGRRVLRHVRRLARAGHAGVVERRRLRVISRASSSSIFASASGCATPWWAPIGWPHTSRSRAYAARLLERQPPRRRPQIEAPMMRSGLSPSKTAPRPPFSPPISRSSSISTSSKNSVHCLSAPRTASGCPGA